MDKLNRKLFKLIDFLIKKQKNSFELNEEGEIKEFVSFKDVIISETNSKKLKVNLESNAFNLQLLDYVELKLNRKLDIDISSSMLFADDFETYLKTNNKTTYYNQFDYIIESFKSWLLRFLNNDKRINVTDFYLNLPMDLEKRERHFDLFDIYFFKAIPYFNLEISVLYNLLDHSLNFEETSYEAFNFMRNFPNENLLKAIELYEYGVKNGILNNVSFSGNLLLGLYRNGYKEAYKISKKLFDNNDEVALFFFSRIEYSKELNLKEILLFIDKVDLSINNNIYACIYFYENLLKWNLDDEINKLCLNRYKEYFKIGNESNRERIISSLSRTVKGLEKERYDFLYFILSIEKKPKFINDYFRTFTDPFYYFDFFYACYFNHRFQTDLGNFEGGINHFWKNSKKETEKYLLKLLSGKDRIIRIGTIKLMLIANCNINLNEIDTEIGQLRAVEAIVSFPHSFNLVLPILLGLRNSKFKNVVKEIQIELSGLIVESYHDELLKWIEKDLGKSARDLKFLKPIKLALNSYHKLKKIKDENKHIDPIENERNLADLYYRLEHENKAIMMQDIYKSDNSFLSTMTKQIAIVRGNSWKSENRDDITPLSKIERSSYIDIKAYKNPDLFEYNLNNPKNKF